MIRRQRARQLNENGCLSFLILFCLFKDCLRQLEYDRKEKKKPSNLEKYKLLPGEVKRGRRVLLLIM